MYVTCLIHNVCRALLMAGFQQKGSLKKDYLFCIPYLIYIVTMAHIELE